MHFQSFRGPKTSKLHTNGIAHVSSNSNIGASTSAQTFMERKQIENSRQYVGSYSDARIYNERRHPPQRVAPLKTLDRFTHPVALTNTRDLTGGTLRAPQQPTGASQRSGNTPIRAARPSIGFRDTPSRGYNPYA